MGKKAAEGGGGLYVAARAVGLADHQRMLDMHAHRLCEDHRAQQIAAGFRAKEEGIDCQMGDDQMGDISVTGDQYYYGAQTKTVNYWPYVLIPILAFLAALTVFLLWPSTPEIQPVDTNTDTVISVE